MHVSEALNGLREAEQSHRSTAQCCLADVSDLIESGHLVAGNRFLGGVLRASHDIRTSMHG